MNSRGIAMFARRISVAACIVVLLMTILTFAWGKLGSSKSVTPSVIGPSAHQLRTAGLAQRKRQRSRKRDYTPGLVNLTHAVADCRLPVWSRNGEMLAFTANGVAAPGSGRIDTQSTTRNLFTMKADGSGLTCYQAAFPGASVLAVDWQNDGAALYVVVKVGNQYQINKVAYKTLTADVSPTIVTLIYTAPGAINSMSLPPDSRSVFFDMAVSGKSQDIYSFPIPATGAVDPAKVQQLTSNAGNNRHPAIANNGNDLVFESDRGGAWRIFKTNPNDGTNTQQLTTFAGPGDDSEPRSSYDGTLLYFTSTRFTDAGDPIANSNIWSMPYGQESAGNAPVPVFFAQPDTLKCLQTDAAPQVVAGKGSQMAFATTFEGGTYQIYLGSGVDSEAPYVLAPATCTPGKVVAPGNTITVSVPVVDHQSGVRAVWLQIKNPNPAVLDPMGVNHVISIPTSDYRTGLNNDPAPASDDPLFWIGHLDTPAFQDIATTQPVEYQLWDPNTRQYVEISMNGDGTMTDVRHHPGFYAAAGDPALFCDANPFYLSTSNMPGMDQLVGLVYGEGHDPRSGAVVYDESPYWIRMHDHNGDGIFTCQLKTPSVASDFYFDIITEDNTFQGQDSLGNWHGNRRRFDNIGGCSTIVNFIGGKRILFVDDYADGQRFMSQGLPGVPADVFQYSQFGIYLSSPYYFMTTNRSTQDAPYEDTLPSAFSPGEPNFGGADVWRLLCRGPVPDYILSSYLPIMTTGVDPTLGRTATNIPHADKLVVWASPHAYFQLIANVPQQDPSIAPLSGIHSGSILETDVQTRLSAFVQNGGRLFVMGAHVPWGLTNLGDTNSIFMRSTLGAAMDPLQPLLFNQLFPHYGYESGLSQYQIHTTAPTPDFAQLDPGLVAKPDYSSASDSWILTTLINYPVKPLISHFYGSPPGGYPAPDPNNGLPLLGGWNGGQLSDTRTESWTGMGGSLLAHGGGVYEHDPTGAGRPAIEVYSYNHNVFPINDNPSYNGSWTLIEPVGTAKPSFYCWEYGDFYMNHYGKGNTPNPAAHPPIVGVSNDLSTAATPSGRTTLWSFGYEHLSSRYRDWPALDTIEWLLDGTLTGTVAQVNSLKPIADALIIANDGTRTVATRSNAMGNYVIKGLHPGWQASLTVKAAGYHGTMQHTYTYPYYLGPAVLGGKVTNNTLTRFLLYTDVNTCAIWGFITRNGIPVHGVSVTATSLGSLTQPVTTISSDTGYYEFNNLPSDTYHIVATDPQNSDMQAATPDPQLSAGERKRVDIAFTKTPVTPVVSGKLTGKVSNVANGAAVPSATVKVSDATTNVSTTTDLNGNYSFANLPKSTYTVVVSGSGFTPVTKTNVAFDPQNGLVLDISVTMLGPTPTQPATIYGQVLDGDTANPLGGATVDLLVGSDIPNTPSQFNITTVGTAQVNYNFTFASLNPGSYTIRVTYKGRRTVARTLNLVAGDVVTDLSFAMLPLLSISPGTTLFSLPGDFNGADVATILGAQPSTLLKRVAGYTAAQGYTFYSGAGTMPIVKGHAYWIHLDNTQYVQGEGTPVNLSVPFAMPLTAGWNLVGNPFSFTVDIYDCQVQANNTTLSWNDAQNQGIVGAQIYTWNGQEYLPTTALQPYYGYWVYAGSNCTMLISNRSAVAALTPSAKSRRGPTSSEWRVRLAVNAGDRVDAASYFGVSTDVGGSNRALSPKPPKPLGDYVMLSFPRPGSGTGDITLAADIRTPLTGEQHWPVRVETNLPNTDVTISWPELLAQLPKGCQATLQDNETQQVLYLNTNRQYTFRSGANGATRNFDLTISPSTHPLLISEIRGRGRGEHADMQINFMLTQPAQVTVTIRSQTGRILRRVSVGMTGVAGINTIPWDGCDTQGRLLPRGNYLCDIQATDAIGRLVRGTGFVTIGSLTP